MTEWLPRLLVAPVVPTSAIASGEFVRYRKDGSVLARLGNAYVFSKSADGWRAMCWLPTRHPPARARSS